MVTNNHTDAFVKKLEDAYNDALHAGSLIAIFRATDHAEVADTHWSYGLDILFNQTETVSALLDDLVHETKNGGAS